MTIPNSEFPVPCYSSTISLDDGLAADNVGIRKYILGWLDSTKKKKTTLVGSKNRLVENMEHTWSCHLAFGVELMQIGFKSTRQETSSFVIVSR